MVTVVYFGGTFRSCRKGVDGLDWNRFSLLSAQIVVVTVLGALVAVGRDSAITDGLLAVSGSVVGTGIYQTVSVSKK